MQQNSEDTIGVDELELMRFLHVPVEGLILLFQGTLMFLLTFFQPLVSIPTEKRKPEDDTERNQ